MEEKIIACKLAKDAGADFVKTSTGLFGKGATVEDVRLMRQTVGKDIGVKAAGGIRTYADAVAMIEAGANRLGTSTAATIIKGAP
jgi:deoxyribose-phosphate aldolase